MFYITCIMAVLLPASCGVALRLQWLHRSFDTPSGNAWCCIAFAVLALLLTGAYIDYSRELLILCLAIGLWAAAALLLYDAAIVFVGGTASRIRRMKDKR